MFAFFQNNKSPYAVERIEEGQLLEKAEEVDIHYFFSCWLNKRPRKAPVGCWFVLHETADFVYFGEPRFKRVFSDKRIVDVFYKTSKKELEERFPIYKKQYDNFIEQKIRAVIKAEQQEDLTPHFVYFFQGLRGHLLPNNTIKITVKCKLKTTNDSVDSIVTTYRITLNSITLNFIALEQIN